MIRLACILVALMTGIAAAWRGRFTIHSDGLSYLEVGEAFVRGDWAMAVSPTWSLPYSWFLGAGMRLLDPDTYWEPVVAHALHLVTYVIALVCFDVLLRELARPGHREVDTGSGEVAMPSPVLYLVGWLVFLHTSVTLIGLEELSPDMLVAAVVFAAGRQLLRLRRGETAWKEFGALGVILGAGYLVKTAMLPLGAVMLVTAAVAARHAPRAPLRLLLAGGLFAVIAGGVAVGISAGRSGVTLGTSAGGNYALFVNGVSESVHWQGFPPGSGTPTHPTRQVLDVPGVFEFATPIGGTYPPWTEPSYWSDGLTPRFELRAQLRALGVGLRDYLRMVRYFDVGLVAVLLIVLCAAPDWRALVRRGVGQWPLLGPALAALAMYGLIHVEPRYVGGFIAVAYLAVFGAARLPAGGGARLWGGVAVAGAMLAAPLWLTTPVATAVRALRSGPDASYAAWEVAQALAARGIRRGEPIAFIGSGHHYYWARLAGARVVAEIRPTRFRNDSIFWAAGTVVRERALIALSNAGARAVVADAVPETAPDSGWLPLGSTGFHLLVLPRAVALRPEHGP